MIALGQCWRGSAALAASTNRWLAAAYFLAPEEFGAMISAETEKWVKVVKFSGAHLD